MTAPGFYDLFGVQFRRMCITDLPLVREHRNRPEMRRWMTTDHEISEGEMLLWFKGLPSNYYYYMVVWQNKIVGQVNLKGVDDACADPGYIFWDDEFVAEGGVCRAALALFSMAFEFLGYSRLVGITDVDNVRALRLAKGLGFNKVAEEKINGKLYVRMAQSKEEFSVIKRKYEGLFL